jgi:hypothetical protein
MRKLALAGIVGMLVGAGGAVALASSISSTVAVKPTAAYLSAGSPEHPQGVRLAMSFGWQGLSPASQPQVTKLDLWFPRGTVYNGALFRTCSLRVLDADGPQGCPKASIMGSGIGTAYADTVITRPTMTVVNGGARAVYFYTVLNNPARVQEPVIGHLTRLTGDFSYHLSVTIPRNLQIVAGVPIKLTYLHISAGRGTWLATTAPPAGIKVVTTFSSGATTSNLVWVGDV